MKLVLAAVLSLASLGSVASADPYYGPPGGGPAPVYQPVAAPAPRGPMQGRGLRRAVLERFDRNHDGRLEPAERRHAAMALRRMADRLERQAPGPNAPAMRGPRARRNVDVDVRIAP